MAALSATACYPLWMLRSGSMKLLGHLFEECSPQVCALCAAMRGTCLPVLHGCNGCNDCNGGDAVMAMAAIAAVVLLRSPIPCCCATSSTWASWCSCSAVQAVCSSCWQ